MKIESLAFFSLVSLAASAVPVTWEFPRTRSCHEGLAFADGATGVLVWGGGETINLTVGRADMWDHRGGYPWTPEQSYTNIVAAVRSGDKDRLLGLFRKDTPPGEPRNPYMLPLGRVVVTLPGATLKTGELDPYTGLGKLILADGKVIELAMSRKQRAFAMKFPENVTYSVKSVPATETGVYERDLQKLGFEKARVIDGSVPNVGGFNWNLPSDKPAWLSWAKRGRELTLRTGRDVQVLAGAISTYEAVSSDSRDYWFDFWW